METTQTTVTETSQPAVHNTVGRRSGPPLIAVLVVVLIIGAGAFVGGMQFQKANSTASTTAASGFGGPGAMAGQRMNGSFGTVSAVSSSSITVKDDRQGTSRTYTISSSTTVTDNGTVKTISDVKTGDNVMVQASSSTSTTATSINLNPTMGGAPGSMNGQTTQPTTGSTT